MGCHGEEGSMDKRKPLTLKEAVLVAVGMALVLVGSLLWFLWVIVPMCGRDQGC